MQGERYELAYHYTSSDQPLLQVGQKVTLLDNVDHDNAWVKCLDETGAIGNIPISHLEIDRYEEHTDPTGDDPDEGVDSADEEPYDDCYVPTEQRLLHCVKPYTNETISVKKGEFVVDVEGATFRDHRGEKMRLVERRGVWKQQGEIPDSCLQPVHALKDQPWFVGNANRQHVEEFLHRPGLLNNSFLVRQSSKTEGYVISILSGNTVRHRKIHRDSTGMYMTVTNVSYNCVTELVYNHHLHKPRGLKLHHAYDKFTQEHANVLRSLGQTPMHQRAVRAFSGNELPIPERQGDRGASRAAAGPSNGVGSSSGSSRGGQGRR